MVWGRSTITVTSSLDGGGGGQVLSDALRALVNTTLKNVIKGEGGGSLKKGLRNC